MARHRFSQKTNGRICFVCFFYSSVQTNQIRPFVFRENLRRANLLFEINWPLVGGHGLGGEFFRLLRLQNFYYRYTFLFALNYICSLKILWLNLLFLRLGCLNSLRQPIVLRWKDLLKFPPVCFFYYFSRVKKHILLALIFIF